MPIITFTKVADSDKSAHQLVDINDKPAGEVWREKAHVPDRKGKLSVKWTWFARYDSDSRVLGRGTRDAVIFGPGFTTKGNAANALIDGRETGFN